MQGHHKTPLAELDPGTVLITPVDEREQTLRGSLSTMDVGGSGLAVSATAEVARTADIGSQPVWVMAKHDGTVIVFHGLARQTRSSFVELTGLSAPLEEHRRAFPRAAVSLTCEMAHQRGDQQHSLGASRVLDISRRSCRVEAPTAETPEKGAYVHLTLDLDGQRLALPAVVQRVDKRTGQIVLGFVAVSPNDAERLDRLVLSRLIPPDTGVSA